MRFVHKPVEVDAVQYTCSKDRWSNTLDILHLTGLKFPTQIQHRVIDGDRHQRYGLQSRFFGCLVDPNDWVVRHPSGSFEVLDPTAFQERYEMPPTAYRFLTDGDKIQIGDELLDQDTGEWDTEHYRTKNSNGRWFLGQHYTPGFHVPMRRRHRV